MHALINESLGLFHKFTSGKYDGSRSITYFIVLRPGDVDQGLGGGVDDVEEADQSGTIVGNGDASAVMDEFVHASGAECCFDNLNNRLTGIDVRDDLASAVALLSALLHDNDLGCLYEAIKSKIYGQNRMVFLFGGLTSKWLIFLDWFQNLNYDWFLN